MTDYAEFLATKRRAVHAVGPLRRDHRTRKGEPMTDIEPTPRDDVADPEALGESDADDGTPGATKPEGAS